LRQADRDNEYDCINPSPKPNEGMFEKIAEDAVEAKAKTARILD
jgi:hypothetical protein